VNGQRIDEPDLKSWKMDTVHSFSNSPDDNAKGTHQHLPADKNTRKIDGLQQRP